MKKFYALFIALLVASSAMTQTDAPCESCLPDGITFSTQSQIDSFQINYPNCTEIEGDVYIGKFSGTNITNLAGLSTITSILGDLNIQRNHQLANLTGLEGLTYIGGNLHIGNYWEGSNGLTSLTGLEGLTAIGGDLVIGYYMEGSGNPLLTSLTGVDNLTFIEGSLIINNNEAITNLIGLESITTIGATLGIGDNDNLTSLSGLEVTSIGGNINISNNNYLTSLTELANCTSISGYLQIHGNNSLTNLTGLNNLTTIGGYLYIRNNTALTSITELANLTSIGSSLEIGVNNSLTNLTGLNNVTSIGGSIWIYFNDALINLTGLEGLISMGGNLRIYHNDALTSITELYNLDASSIVDMEIYTNNLLTNCEARSVCEYLVSPNGTVDISDNAVGCNSPEEVQDSCEAHAGIIDAEIANKLLIYPNPSNSSITIELPSQPSKDTFLNILNTQGQQLITQAITESKTEISISHLPAGVYIVKVWGRDGVMTGKVLVE